MTRLTRPSPTSKQHASPSTTCTHAQQLDTDEVTVENSMSKSFDQVIRMQLDPVWNQLVSWFLSLQAQHTNVLASSVQSICCRVQRPNSWCLTYACWEHYCCEFLEILLVIKMLLINLTTMENTPTVMLVFAFFYSFLTQYDCVTFYSYLESVR